MALPPVFAVVQAVGDTFMEGLEMLVSLLSMPIALAFIHLAWPYPAWQSIHRAPATTIFGDGLDRSTITGIEPTTQVEMLKKAAVI